MKTFEDLVEEYDDLYAPRFEVTVDGEAFDETDGLIGGLTVETSLSTANAASFTLTGEWDPAAGEFVRIDWDTWTRGATLDVRLGYGEHLQWLFHGQIQSIEPSFSADGSGSVQVTAHDPRTQLQRKSADEDWTETSVGAAVRDVVTDAVDRGQAGSTVEDYDFPELQIEGTTGGGEPRRGGDLPGVAPGDLELEVLKQLEQSDRSFLSDLATSYGYELFFRGGTFHFRRPLRYARPSIELRYGQSLRSFSPADPGEDPDVGTVVVTDFDATSQRDVEGDARRPAGSRTVRADEKVESTQEARARAHALLQQHGEHPTARGEIVGVPDVRIGTPVSVTGLGRFSGACYVTEATHRIDDSGYTTTLSVETLGDGETEL